MLYCQNICGEAGITMCLYRVRSGELNHKRRYEVPPTHLEVTFLGIHDSAPKPFNAAVLKNSIILIAGLQKPLGSECGIDLIGDEQPRLIEHVIQAADNLSYTLLQTRYLEAEELEEFYKDEAELVTEEAKRIADEKHRAETEESSEQPGISVAVKGDLVAQRHAIATELRNMGAIMLSAAALLERDDQEEKGTDES